MRFFFIQFPLHDPAQFLAVGGDKFLLHLAAADRNGDMVGVGRDQGVAALKPGDEIDLGIGEFEYLLYKLRLVFLKVQDDLDLAVVEDAAAVLAALECEKVGNVLRGDQRRAAVERYKQGVARMGAYICEKIGALN